MKKIICLTLVFLLVLPMLFSCAEEGRYHYDLLEYISLGEVQPISAYFEDPEVCTEEEIDEALFQVMLSYADFSEKEGAAEKYNRIEMVYDLYYDGKILEEYHEEEYSIVIGSDNLGDLDYLLGEAFIGANVGDVKKIQYTFPSDDFSLGFWAGLTVEAEGKLSKVYQHSVPQCTDEFVRSLEGYSFETIADFREQLADDIRQTKLEKKADAVYDAFMDGVTVLKYPEKEFEKYVEDYQKDSKELAQQLEMSYEDYLKEYLSTDVQTFISQAEEEAEKLVKADMACIQLSRLLGTTLSQEEYDEGLQMMYESEGGEDSDFATIEEYEEYYTVWEIRERLLWKKSFASLVENAVRLEKE